MSEPTRDPWAFLGALTPARLALGRTGASMPTREVLSFALSHAQARDAVNAEIDLAHLATRIEALGLQTEIVASRAPDRATYLQRPDLGRRLDALAPERLHAASPHPACDLAIMIGDGLSPRAVADHAVPLLTALQPHIRRLGLTLGPVVLAKGARVALGDEVGSALGARIVAVIIGERPGLSAPDSLGIYLTYAPRPGRTDAERNCISNVRPAGLPPLTAAANFAWLLDAALAKGATGVTLKDMSDSAGALLDPSSAATITAQPTDLTD